MTGSAPARSPDLTRVRIATWNVNSIRAREAHVGRFLERQSPDLVLLQEIKCEEAQFPALAFSAFGYRAAVVGQKSYNGVAVLSKQPFEVLHRALPGLDEQKPAARYLEIRLADAFTVGNLYLPNGNSGGEDGYRAKLAWMTALRARADALLADDVPFLLAGDFNVCPRADDLAPGTLPPNDALVRPETRQHYRALLHAGLTDAARALQPTGSAWTFWDYQAGAWPRDRGLRIDHALLSPTVAERLVACSTDRVPRGEDQPSDHAPVIVELDQ